MTRAKCNYGTALLALFKTGRLRYYWVVWKETFFYRVKLHWLLLLHKRLVCVEVIELHLVPIIVGQPMVGA